MCLLLANACKEPPPLSDAERWEAQQRADESGAVDRLRSVMTRFELPSGNAGLDCRDLAPVLRLIASAKVVGLGESTHGTQEFFVLKAALVRCLALSTKGLVVAIEASTSYAADIDAFIQAPAQDARQPEAGMGFWVFNNPEMEGLIAWLRRARQAGQTDARWAGLDPRPIEEARKRAPGGRIERQLLDIERGLKTRDEAMAENVLSLLDDGASKVVLWAHNSHIARNGGTGARLASRLGPGYLAVGLDFGRGVVTVKGPTGEPTPVRVREPPLGTVEHALLQLPEPGVFIDLRPLASDPGLARQWLQTAPGLRSIGCCYPASVAAAEFAPSAPVQSFDALLFLHEGTAEKSRLPTVRVE